MELSRYVQDLRDIIHEQGVYEADELMSMHNIRTNKIEFLLENSFISYIRLRNSLNYYQDMYIQEMASPIFDKSMIYYKYYLMSKNKRMFQGTSR